MTALTPLDPILIVALWTWALWGATMRTRRTVVFLVAVSIAYVVSTQLPGPWSAVLRAGVLTASVWLLLFRTAIFSALPSDDLEFNEAYRGALNEAADLARRHRSGRLGAEDFVNRLSGVATQLQRLDAPSDEWAVLQNRTVDYLRRQVVAFRELPHAQSNGDGGDEVERLRREYDRVVRKATRVR